MEEQTNERRAERASVALNHYSVVSGPGHRQEDDETRISDLICDLRHLADANGADWDVIQRKAAFHYGSEMADHEGFAMEPDPVVYVWTTGGDLYFETGGGVRVFDVNWDNYRAPTARDDYEVEDLLTTRYEILELPTPTPELARIKTEAIQSLNELITEWGANSYTANVVADTASGPEDLAEYFDEIRTIPDSGYIVIGKAASKEGWLNYVAKTFANSGRDFMVDDYGEVMLTFPNMPHVPIKGVGPVITEEETE